VQLFAGLKSHGLAGCDADLSASPGIAANPGLASADTEHAEAAQLDAFTSRQRLFQALKDRINRRFSLGPRQAGTLNHVMNDVLLDQWSFLAMRLKKKPAESAESLYLQTLTGGQGFTAAIGY
jgi:hypothetical protein